MESQIRVCFLFRSKSGRAVGGAEKSMLRLIKETHPKLLDCHVILESMVNQELYDLFYNSGIKVHLSNNIFNLYKILRTLHPEILYLFTRMHFGVIWAITARLADVPIIISPERGWGGGVANRISHVIGKYFVNGFIANSKSAAKYLEKAGIPNNKIFVIYNGIDEIKIEDNSLVSNSIGLPSIVCVANILPLKGQEVLLQAIQILRTDFPEIQAVLIGKDYTRGRFFRKMEQMNLQNTYSWLGFVNNVQGYIQQADIFVLPSMWGEGMPTALLEAMLAGKPIVASATGGIPELIVDNETGLLASPGDAKMLAVQIRKLLNNPELCNTLGQSARQHALVNHSISKMAEGHIEAFSTLLAQID